jgi:hypothetical protein
MDVHAEAPGAAVLVRRRAAEAEGEVRGSLGVDLLADAGSDERGQQRMDVVRRERGVRGPDQPSADAEHRRRTGDDQQVARAALSHFDEHRFERIALGDVRRRPRCGRARFIRSGLRII